MVRKKKQLTYIRMYVYEHTRLRVCFYSYEWMKQKNFSASFPRNCYLIGLHSLPTHLSQTIWLLLSHFQINKTVVHKSNNFIFSKLNRQHWKVITLQNISKQDISYIYTTLWVAIMGHIEQLVFHVLGVNCRTETTLDNADNNKNVKHIGRLYFTRFWQRAGKSVQNKEAESITDWLTITAVRRT